MAEPSDGYAMRIALRVLNDVARVLQPPLRPQDVLKVMVPHPKGTLAGLDTPGSLLSMAGGSTSDHMLRCHVVSSNEARDEHAVHEFYVGRTSLEKLLSWPRLPPGIGRYITDTLPSSRSKALLLAVTQDGDYQVRWVRQSCDSRRMQMDPVSSPQAAYKDTLRTYGLRQRAGP